jgi:hypothetical protein
MFSIEQRSSDLTVVYRPADERAFGALGVALIVAVICLGFVRNGFPAYDFSGIGRLSIVALAAVPSVLMLFTPVTIMEYKYSTGRFAVIRLYYWGTRCVFDSTSDDIATFGLEIVRGYNGGPSDRLYINHRDDSRVMALRWSGATADAKDAVQLLGRAAGVPVGYKTRWLYRDWDEVTTLDAPKLQDLLKKRGIHI